MGLPSQVVAIVENVASCSDELEQPFHVSRDRRSRTPQVLVGVGRSKLGSLDDVEACGDVPVQRIMGSRLVGHEIEALTPPRELRHELRGVPE